MGFLVLTQLLFCLLLFRYKTSIIYPARNIWPLPILVTHLLCQTKIKNKQFKPSDSKFPNLCKKTEQ